MQNLMDDVPVSVPVVFSEDECQRIIGHLKGSHRLMAAMWIGQQRRFTPMYSTKVAWAYRAR